MAIDRLKGAAGVVINTIDKSATSAAEDTSYKVGIIGWSPKGPTNTPTLVKSVEQLNTLFGTPKNYNANEAKALHGAKILLDSGANVQFVRVTQPVSYGSSPTIDEKYTSHEELAHVAYTLDSEYTMTDVKSIGDADKGKIAYEKKYPIVAKSSNLDEISENGLHQLTASADEKSPFTIYSKYPGVEGQYADVEVFNALLSDKKHVTQSTAISSLKELKHYLNIIPGSDDTSDDIQEYRQYVLSQGLYQTFTIYGEENANGSYLKNESNEYIENTSDLEAFTTLCTEIKALGLTDAENIEKGITSVASQISLASTSSSILSAASIGKFAQKVSTCLDAADTTARLGTTLIEIADLINATYDSTNKEIKMDANYSISEFCEKFGYLNNGVNLVTDDNADEVLRYMQTCAIFYNISDLSTRITSVLSTKYSLVLNGDFCVNVNDTPAETASVTKKYKFYRFTGFDTNETAIPAKLAAIVKEADCKSLETITDSNGNVICEENTNLEELISHLYIIRIYDSKTSQSPIDTMYVTDIDYVSEFGSQLSMNEYDSDYVLFKTNTAFASASNSIFDSNKSKLPLTVQYYSNESKTKSNIDKSKHTGAFKYVPNNYGYPEAWALFADVSNIDVRLLCDCGSSINGFGLDSENSDAEYSSQSIVQAMLNTSTKRQDCPCIFDYPKTKSAKKAIKRFTQLYPTMGAETSGSTASYEVFWGNVQDGRQIIMDNYNKKRIEAPRSIFKAVATYNVYSNSKPWQTCWGPNRGLITSPSIGTINPRVFPDEVGALSTAHLNPTKNSSDGEYFWDDWTLMSKSSSLQRWHAVNGLAWLYRRLRVALEQYVGELNTSTTRSNLYTDVDTILAYMQNSTPSGLYDYYVICDSSNNTADVIDKLQIICDIGIELVKDTRTVILNNVIYRTGGISTRVSESAT